MTVVAYLLEHRLPKPRGAGINDTSSGIGKKCNKTVLFFVKICRYRQENAIFALFSMNKLADRRNGYGIYFCC